jgi:hypothetical protein
MRPFANVIGRWLGKYPAAAGVLVVPLNKDARGRAWVWLARELPFAAWARMR